jgi:hypothetical protein
MTPVLVSVDKAGDLKIGRKKCRLYKKDEVVKVAKKYGINTEKKTVGELCSAIRSRAKSSPMNNIPLAKLYPEAAKKRVAAKKRAEKKALNKKVAANFMKAMTTRIATPTRATVRAVMPMPKPQKKAMPLTKDVARKRIMAMKGLNGRNKFSLVNRLSLNQHSPRRVVRLARELARLR